MGNLTRMLIGRLCVIGIFLNLFNLSVLGAHPLPLISLGLCIFGAVVNLK